MSWPFQRGYCEVCVMEFGQIQDGGVFCILRRWFEVLFLKHKISVAKMKSSLRKLRGFSLSKHGVKEKLGAVYHSQKQQQLPPPASLDELVQASQVPISWIIFQVRACCCVIYIFKKIELFPLKEFAIKRFLLRFRDSLWRMIFKNEMRSVSSLDEFRM